MVSQLRHCDEDSGQEWGMLLVGTLWEGKGVKSDTENRVNKREGILSSILISTILSPSVQWIARSGLSCLSIDEVWNLLS